MGYVLTILIYYFFLGFVPNFLVILYFRTIAKDKIVLANIVSFLTTAVSLYVLLNYDIFSQHYYGQTFVSTFSSICGVVLGAFTAMRFDELTGKK